MDSNPIPDPVPRPTLGTLIGRAALLRCLACGQSRMFVSWFKMHGRCPECGYLFARENGYFLGSIYFNYGITGLLMIIAHLILLYGYQVDMVTQSLVLLPLCAVFTLWFFRYSRALWMILDLSCDPPKATDYERTPEASAREADAN